jgi:hypothetical protein
MEDHTQEINFVISRESKRPIQLKLEIARTARSIDIHNIVQSKPRRKLSKVLHHPWNW